MTEPALIIDTNNETPHERRLRAITRQRHTPHHVELRCTTYRFPRDAHISLTEALADEGVTVKDLIWKALSSACEARGIPCPINAIKRGPVPRKARQMVSLAEAWRDPETIISVEKKNNSNINITYSKLDIYKMTGRRLSYRRYLNKILYNT